MKWIIWRATCRVREFIRMILEYPCLTLNKVIVPVILKVSMFYTHNERKKRTIHGHHAERQIRKLCALKFRNLNTVQSWMINMGNYFSSSKKKKYTRYCFFISVCKTPAMLYPYAEVQCRVIPNWPDISSLLPNFNSP